MRKVATLLFISALFFSCSSDEAKSSENYIEKFTVEGVTPIQIFLKQDQNLIQVLTFQGSLEALSNISPKITVSENATLYQNGRDWTADGFFYTVVAENGESRNYFIQLTIAYNKYSFETWVLSNGNDRYYVPSEKNSIWSSGNAGISIALSILKIDSKNPENYPTRKTDKGYNGSNAVVMETIKGGNVAKKNIPIISGNFFLGNFNFAKALSDELVATEVGSIYPAKPKKVKGFYKYKEGILPFIGDANNPNRPDSCNLHISFYQGDSPNSGKDTTLTIRDIDTYHSELVIADATLADCSETSGDGFHQFTLDFGNYKKEPDFKNHYYKIAITFAASRNGDKYAGKIGSKLIVDEVEIEDY